MAPADLLETLIADEAGVGAADADARMALVERIEGITVQPILERGREVMGVSIARRWAPEPVRLTIRSTLQAARYFGVTKGAVHHWMQAGDLRSLRSGRRHYVIDGAVPVRRCADCDGIIRGRGLTARRCGPCSGQRDARLRRERDRRRVRHSRASPARDSEPHAPPSSAGADGRMPRLRPEQHAAIVEVWHAGGDKAEIAKVLGLPYRAVKPFVQKLAARGGWYSLVYAVRCGRCGQVAVTRRRHARRHRACAARM
jgi:hypothetical protein